MNLTTIARSPLLVAQAVWVMARATRLPEAQGPRTGCMGVGPARRLVVLGDSSAAGVGVPEQSQALGGRLAAELAPHYQVTWEVIAKSGATVRSTRRSLEVLPADKADFVLIALGVNDTKNGVRARAWNAGYRELLDAIAAKFNPSCIVVTGLPPLRHFPLLPAPLNAVLGERAEVFEEILKEIADQRGDTRHLAMDMPLDPANMASDGFHPSAKLYREWAKRAAVLFRASDG